MLLGGKLLLGGKVMLGGGARTIRAGGDRRDGNAPSRLRR